MPTGRPQLTHHEFIWITVIILIFFNHSETGSNSLFQAHLWIGIYCLCPVRREKIGESRAGSRYFCESLFWASQPKQAAKT
jgi:hypothetical protein